MVYEICLLKLRDLINPIKSQLRQHKLTPKAQPIHSLPYPNPSFPHCADDIPQRVGQIVAAHCPNDFPCQPLFRVNVKGAELPPKYRTTIFFSQKSYFFTITKQDIPFKFGLRPRKCEIESELKHLQLSHDETHLLKKQVEEGTSQLTYQMTIATESQILRFLWIVMKQKHFCPIIRLETASQNILVEGLYCTVSKKTISIKTFECR